MIAGFLVAMLSAVNSGAGPIGLLDQYAKDPPPSGISSHGSVFGRYSYEPLGVHAIDVAQTFTVGIPGRLSYVEVFMNYVDLPTDPLVLDIRRTIDGVPVENDTEALGFLSVGPAAVPQGAHAFVGFDLTSLGIEVTSGEMLAFVLQSNTSFGNEYGTSGTAVIDQYASGQYFHRVSWDTGQWKTAASNVDLRFATYVTPASVPDPGSTLLLLGMALVGLRACRKRM